MPSSLPGTYPYKPKGTTIILCILFFGACAAVLGYKACTNDRGLILSGVITLSPGGASIFYWILTALSLGFVLVGIFMTVQRAGGSASLEITGSSLRIPRGFITKTITEIEFRDVIDLSETEVQGHKFFYLHTAHRKYCLNRALMPSADAYEEAKALVTAAIAAHNAEHREEDRK